MRVTHFVNDYRGGLARYVERLVAAQRNAPGTSWVVDVFGPKQLNIGEGVGRALYRPVEKTWGLNQWKFAYDSWRWSRPGLRHFHNYTFGKIDVLTCHGLYTHNWLAKYGHGRVPPQRRAQFTALSALERRCLASAKVVVFQSVENQEFVEEHFQLKRSPGVFRRILQAVDTGRFRPFAEGERLKRRGVVFPQISASSRWLLFVGHDFEGKGLIRILQEFAARRVPLGQYSVLVFGDDALNRSRAGALAEKMGLSIHFLPSDQLLDAYRCSDFLLLDSVSEGAPLVLLEGMACGCVPIFTPCGGVRETIQHGVNGWVADSAAGIVECAMVTSEVERMTLSLESVRTVQTRSLSEFERQYRMIYESLGSGL
mgnify:CR=1 FL=1